MPYITPSAMPTGFICRPLRIPKNWEWLAIVSGAISELTKAENFEKVSGLEPEDVASVFRTMFDEYMSSECGENMLIGEIRMVAYNFTEAGGWLICDGRAVSRTVYSELFAILGTTWGAGDGSTTFNLPSASYRVPRGAAGFEQVGQYGGKDSITLTQANLPVNTIISGGGAVGASPGQPDPITRKTSVATGIDVRPSYFSVKYIIYSGVT